MDPISTEPATQRDLEHLEEILDGRLSPIEKAIESLTEVIQRMSDQGTRIAVLETKQAVQDKTIEELRVDAKESRAEQIKLSCYVAVGIGLLALVIPPVMDAMLT
jgi:hypothetical protein